MNSCSMKRIQDYSNIYNSSLGEHQSYTSPIYSPFFNTTMRNVDNKHDINKETSTHGKAGNEETLESEAHIKAEINDVSESSETPNNICNDDLFRIQHEEYLIVCDMCDFESTSHKDMDVHRLSHGLKRTNGMPIYSFTNNSVSENTGLKSNTRSRKGFACDMCPYFGKTSTQLVSHKKSHSAEKSYTCSQCPYRCKYLSGLRYHQLSHNNSKVFKCHECAFTCMTAALLKSHMRKHSSVAPFSCHLCSYTCKYPAGLRYHVLSHTKGKDISCTLCNYVCRTPGELKIHSKKHTPETMMCEFCGFSCKTKKTMIQHKNSVCANRTQNS